jgi:hypothetical protein
MPRQTTMRMCAILLWLRHIHPRTKISDFKTFTLFFSSFFCDSFSFTRGPLMRAVFIKPDASFCRINDELSYFRSMQIYEFTKTSDGYYYTLDLTEFFKSKSVKEAFKNIFKKENRLTISVHAEREVRVAAGDTVNLHFSNEQFENYFRVVSE